MATDLPGRSRNLAAKRQLSDDSDDSSSNNSDDDDTPVRSQRGAHSREPKPPATTHPNPTELIREISRVSKDLNWDGPETAEQYRQKVIPSVQDWPGVPGKKVPTFVHLVLEESLLEVKVKEFLLRIAIPARWEQLTTQTPDSNGRTALHDAVEKDEATKDVLENERTNFTSLFCSLLQEGIASESLTKSEAAKIIAKTNNDGENCLHLALKFDLPVAEELIELADRRTFLQQRALKGPKPSNDDGNTPLHDALEFSHDVQNALKGSHKYLTQAPKCPTEALCTPLEAYVCQPACYNRAYSVCKRCEDIDETYSKLKSRRSRILCILLSKCQTAMTCHNKAGQSPLIYHMTAREEFKMANPDFKMKASRIKKRNNIKEASELISPIEVRKEVNPNTETRGSISGVAGARNEPSSPINPADSTLDSSHAASKQAALANMKIARLPTTAQPPGVEVTNLNEDLLQDTFPSPQMEQIDQRRPSIRKPDKCNSRLLHSTYYKFSEEIEKFLWEKVFCMEGYNDAHKCLFPRWGVSHGEPVRGELRIAMPTLPSRLHSMCHSVRPRIYANVFGH
jgi:hypothetical protein